MSHIRPLLLLTTPLLVLALISAPSRAKTYAPEENLATIRKILELPDHQIDLAKAKLAIDRMVDPGIDVDATLKQLDAMAAQVEATVPARATSRERLEKLRKYIYEPGDWNGGQAFEYDLDDPLGYHIRNKLLSTYLETRKGNCVSMPILFVVLGQKLGIDVTLTTAPDHFLAKYRDRAGNWINIEATSGGTFARDVWLQQQMPMTAKALALGVYLKPLSKREAVVAMLSTLMEFYHDQGWYEENIALANLALIHHPKDVVSMLRLGASYGSQRDRECSLCARPGDIPVGLLFYCKWLNDNTGLWWSRAEALGWREPTPETNATYLRRVAEEKNRRLK